jgi:SUF system NifU family Fe-S assembly protein
MTSRDARTLYQELIVEHGNAPRNAGPLEAATHEAMLKNPLCGDRVTVRLRVLGAGIGEARFEARGCMIARASASLMTVAIQGRSVSAALALARALDAILAGEPVTQDDGALDPLRGARDFPARRGCVTLAWRALEQALASGGRARD